MEVVLIYAICVNLIAFIMYRIDKRRAIKKQWRIPEKYLFLIAIVGGAIGSLCGMYICRHKTKHWYFVLGIPAILVIHIVAILWYVSFTVI